MKENELHKYNTGGKRRKLLKTLFVVSLVAAFVLASFPMASVFAAPAAPDDGEWEQKQANLRAEMAIANTLQTQPGRSCVTAADAKYRDQYIATMRAAQTLLVNPDAFLSNNGNNNGNGDGGSAVGGYYQNNPEKLMAAYLHRMRQLREKISLGSDGQNGNNGGNNSQNVCLNFNTNTTGNGTESGTGTGTGTGTTTPTPTATP